MFVAVLKFGLIKGIVRHLMIGKTIDVPKIGYVIPVLLHRYVNRQDLVT